jgi:twitching motility protein PilT
MELSQLLKLAIEEKASDLHLSPGHEPILRIQGDLVTTKKFPILDGKQILSLLHSIMSNEQKLQFATDLEMDFSTQLADSAGFRINAFNQLNGAAAVFRVIPEECPTLESLDLPPIFRQLVELRNGLILLTGPTGSGKSTTLAAMVDYINKNQTVHIITIEDPIEFVHHSKKSLINQRQVHRDTHNFAAALRSALREDPDVILVGELRDLETIRLALTAAETGHLVIATLHSSSAPRAISRIIDVFPAGEKNIIRNMLSESLEAAICQTLVKKIKGGRAAAMEIMLGSTAIRNHIREDKIAQMTSTIQTSSQLGMCTLDQSLQILVQKQIITSSAAREHAINKDLFTF